VGAEAAKAGSSLAEQVADAVPGIQVDSALRWWQFSKASFKKAESQALVGVISGEMKWLFSGSDQILRVESEQGKI